ncbi:MAG TPA: hypothetical protein VGG07_07075 [Solirubrobacteraceae bacterium]
MTSEDPDAPLPSQPDVSVATGDPGALDAAGAFHSDLADSFDGHATALSTAAGSLDATWNGEAAVEYQALSSFVTNHFQTAAAHSRTAATTLHRYASELDRCQQEGLHALRMAEKALQEAQQWTRRLDTARKAVTSATDELHGAQQALSEAGAQGPHAAAAAGIARQEISGAQDALHTAQGQERTAHQQVTHFRRELARWETGGANVFNEAKMAAVNATGSLEPLALAPPPLAVVTPRNAPVMPTSDGGLLPQSPLDWTFAGVGGASGGISTWAAQEMERLNGSRTNAMDEARRLREQAVDDPDLTAAERKGLLGRANALSDDARSLGTRVENLGDHLKGGLADGGLGFGIGGIVDGGVHLAEGDSPGKSALEGAASAGGGYVGAIGAGGACAAVGAEPLVPVCGVVGGAVGGWVGDKLGGLIGGLFD